MNNFLNDNELTGIETILESASAIPREDSGSNRNLLTLRRIVALGDFCAANPDAWKANRLHFFMPHLSHAQIAGLLRIPRASVTRYLLSAEIGEEVYDSLPDDI